MYIGTIVNGLARKVPRMAAGTFNRNSNAVSVAIDLAVIDAGHAATELPSLDPLALRLTELVDVPVEVSRVLR